MQVRAIGGEHPREHVAEEVQRGARGALGAQPPAHDRAHGVEHRQRHQHHRHQRERAARSMADAQRDRRQHESHEQAAGIAHEDQRRVEVEPQESEQRAGECDGRDAREGIFRPEDETHRQRAGQRHAACEAVQAVDEVEGVGHEHDPAHGERQAQGAEGSGAEAGQVHRLDAPSAAPQRHRRRHLNRELDARSQPAHVVDQTQDQHRAGTSEQAQQPELGAGDQMLPARIAVDHEQQRARESPEDPQSSQARGRPAMHAPAPGPVHGAQPQRRDPHELSCTERRGQCDRKAHEPRVQCRVLRRGRGGVARTRTVHFALIPPPLDARRTTPSNWKLG